MTILQSSIVPSSGYLISRSLRFNSADSAYLNRTLTTPTNNKIFTFSAWVKRSALGASQTLFDAYVPATSFDLFRFNSSDQIEYFDNTAGYLTSTQVFRDVGAWYHVMAAVDTTQATSSNRVKLYVNGTQITAFSATAYPSQNQAIIFNSAVVHDIGRFGYSANAYLNGYLTEVNFIDGQALTPSSFGETDAATGVWKPKKYTGTYGTNGFYLNFSDNSGTTSTTLGKDSSGNGNNWTPNNFSVTAGAGNDSLVDTPTAYGSDTGAGGEVRGNYATLNPLKVIGTAGTFSNGNLNITVAVDSTNLGTMAVSSGKWYFEIQLTAATETNANIGIADPAVTQYFTNAGTYVGYGYQGTGNKGSNGSYSSYGATYTVNDIIGVALDLDAGTLVFYKNGASQGTAYTGISGTFAPAVANGNSGSTKGYAANFGQRPFAYTAPSGYKALCTQNLPTPTIGATSTTTANKYFDATLYTGTSASQSVTNSGSMQPDLVWIKSRSAATNHKLTDAVRGTTKGLISNTTGAETTDTNGLTAFNSNGFTVGSDSVYNNGTGPATYVGWQWNAGGSFDAIQSYTTAGSYTYTVPAGVTSIRVMVIGGGGGSGGSGAGAGAGGAGGNSNFGTITGNGGGGGGAGPNVSGAGGTAGSGSGGDGGFSGITGEAGTGSGVTYRWSGSAYLGYGDSAGHYGWGGGGGTGGTRYATLSVTPGSTYSVTVGAAGAAGAGGAGGGGWPGIAGAVFVYGSSNWPINVDGSITSLVRANTTAGFSIVTYTGTGANATVGHGLGVAPSMVIVKIRTNVVAEGWGVWHTALVGTEYLALNTTAAKATAAAMWNSTTPTSSVFSLGTDNWTNKNTATYVAYCFAPVAGYSAFGSYTGNGSTDGPFVFCGFRPRYVMVKKSSASGTYWIIADAVRNTYNVVDYKLAADLSDAENSASIGNSTQNNFDFLSNGFKLRTTTGDTNASSATYIYAAFAESPFKYSLAR